MHSVSVGRLTVNCAVSRNHPDPQAVRSRLDRISDGALQAALAELLAPLARLGDEVIVIRKLELSFDLDTSLGPSELARSWAARLAAAVAAHLRPEARASMLRFPDQPHYLARFLADAASGRGPNAWYYRRWRGLASLALPAILRSAIVEEPARGLLALRALSPSELPAVLAALGAHEARRVVETVAAGADDGAGFDDVAAVLAPLVPAWLPLAAALASPWSGGLALLTQASETLMPAELPRAARLAVALAAWRADRVQAQRSGGAVPAAAARIAATLDGAGLPDLVPLVALAPHRREQLLAPLGERSDGEVDASPAQWYTRFGGLLLLLPRIAELPLHEIWRHEPDRACARLVILSRAAGTDGALTDPVLRRICGVPDNAALDDWLAVEAPRIAAALPAALWNRAFCRARSLQILVTRHRVWGPLQIAIAEPDGDWLAIAPLSRELRAGLRVPACDVGIAIAARPALSSAHALGRVLAHVVSDPSPAPIAEPALALAAQQVLRAFARRLPGFADSSPRFLHDNFLDFDATVIESQGTFHCRVGRPRLAAIFGLTGALRGRIPLGFGDSASLELYPGG